MKDYKKYLPWTIRGIIAFLFLLSAVAKLYPSPYFAISTFEFSQLYPMGFSENLAAYFSRILIGIEFALGILILQKHYLKKLVIPATVLLLAVFTIHLSYVTFVTGGNTGNCGCFGSLLPMTPIEAIIKNVIAMILLVILYKLLPKSETKHNFWILTTAVLGCILMLFMLAPINRQTTSNFTTIKVEDVVIDSVTIPVVDPIEIEKSSKEFKIEPSKTEAKPTEIVVSKTKSGYANFYPNIDEGRQVLCFFVPGCDHCRATAKELTEMRKSDPNFPKMQIIFMDEEANLIPEFFQAAGTEYPYQIVGIIEFWKLLGVKKQVPGVKYIKNGKVIKYYFGTEGVDKFNIEDFRKIIQ
jgi:hypothetical protein